MWQLNIRKANNGYILKGKFNDSEDVAEICIEEKESSIDNVGELKTMKEVLLTIIEYFAVYYSQHNNLNLIVSIIDKDGKEVEEE